MTRPRKRPFEFTVEQQKAYLRENLSRRELVRLLGVAGATSLAGCGGGGQQTPSPTEAGTPVGGQDTPTEAPDTPSGDTPSQATDTPTEESGGTTTTTGRSTIEVTDHVYPILTTVNLEGIHPQTWHAETGFKPRIHGMPLIYTSQMMYISSELESLYRIMWLQAIDSLELDAGNQSLTMHVRDDLAWGDGSQFDAENVLMHHDLIQSQLELGEQGETSLPLSIEATDEFTLEATLIPGNYMIRVLELFFGGRFVHAHRTHPKLHGEWVEGMRGATTDSARQSVVQDLLSTKFSREKYVDMALGGFLPTDISPDEITYEARTDFPWGLHYRDDVDRIFGGATLTSVGSRQTLVNAATQGNQAWTYVATENQTRRFQGNYHRTTRLFPGTTVVYFGPKWRFGKKTERARKVRQAIAFLLDAEETAGIIDNALVYEQSTPFNPEHGFEEWIGNDFYFENYTNYGHKETGYLFEEEGYAKLREANFERNRNGAWVDAESGEPLAPTYKTETVVERGLTRPVVVNPVEQLNRHGIQVQGQVLADEQYYSMAEQSDFELAFVHNQSEVHPHFYFGYREDAGIGSRDGLPASVNHWDWRNGYRRLDVPMPIGNPDGEVTQYDVDSTILRLPQVTDPEEMKGLARELGWINNQWMPGVQMVMQTNYNMINQDLTQVDRGDFIEEAFYTKAHQERLHLWAWSLRPPA